MSEATRLTEVDASDSETIPTRTFTLATGEPVTIVEVPTEGPMPPTEEIKEVTIVESCQPAAEEEKEEVDEYAQKEHKVEEIVEQAETERKAEEVVEQAAAERKEEENVEQAEAEQKAEEIKEDAIILKESTRSTEPAAETIVVEECEPVETIADESKPVETITVEDSKSAQVIMVEESKPVEDVTIIEAAPAQEERVQEILVKRPTVAERSISMPILPTQSIQKSRTVVEAVEVPIVAAGPIEVVGKLEALRRRIAIFNSSVALTSICLRWSDKFHHELIDSSGHIVFSLHNRHKLCDGNGKEVACLHKSMWRSRWHAESMKHQNRLLTACQRHHGLVLQIRIHNCFTNRSEELVLLRNRLYDGSDPNMNRIAVLFDRDGMI